MLPHKIKIRFTVFLIKVVETSTTTQYISRSLSHPNERQNSNPNRTERR
jgi:hypothetical protein